MNIKYSIVSLALITLAGCSSTSNLLSNSDEQATNTNQATQNTTNSEPQTSTELQARAHSEPEVSHNGEQFIVASNIPYIDETSISSNIIAECHQLGRQFSNSFVKYARINNVPVQQTSKELPNDGRVVKLYIDDVYSAGNAFIGHRKSATVRAELFVDGKSVASTTQTRHSGGGFMGGFKGSCSVLAHTVNTLGNDIAKWVKVQQRRL